MATTRKLSLLQILADPRNRSVSSKFIKFAVLMILLPLGFLLLSMRLGIFSVEVSAIISVVLVNVVMGIYALGAYREEDIDSSRKDSQKVD